LDQRLLPQRCEYQLFNTAVEIAHAIQHMVVRGAPAIGITAAYGVVLAAREAYARSGSNWREAIKLDLERLLGSRPTAVNLHWAIARMQTVFPDTEGDSGPRLLAAAQAIQAEDIAANRCMGGIGATLITPGSTVLTHCNTGSLATDGFGTALGVIRSAYAHGAIKTVYVGETRPGCKVPD
jgi:methylthioribose-1-phosphate isomerase